MLLTDFY